MKKTVRANHTEDETVVIEGGRNHSVDPLRLDAVLGDAASRSSVIVKFHSPGRTPFVQRVDQGDDAEVNKIVRLVRDSRVPVNRIEITEQVRGGVRRNPKSVRRKPSLFERAVERAAVAGQKLGVIPRNHIQMWKHGQMEVEDLLQPLVDGGHIDAESFCAVERAEADCTRAIRADDGHFDAAYANLANAIANLDDEIESIGTKKTPKRNPHPTRARKSAYDSQGDVAAALYEFRTQCRTVGDRKSSWDRVVAARGRAEDEDLSAKAYGPLDADEIAAQRGQSSGLRALAKGNLPGASNKYEAFWRGKRITVEAPSSYAAQKIAADKLKAKKTREVAIVLVELADGSPISIDPASL